MADRVEKLQKTIAQLQETHEADQKYIVPLHTPSIPSNSFNRNRAECSVPIISIVHSRIREGGDADDPEPGFGTHHAITEGAIRFAEHKRDGNGFPFLSLFQQRNDKRYHFVTLKDSRPSVLPKFCTLRVGCPHEILTIIILNQREFILSLLNELLDLSAANKLLDRLNLYITNGFRAYILILLDNVPSVICKRLDILSVLRIGRDLLIY